MKGWLAALVLATMAIWCVLPADAGPKEDRKKKAPVSEDARLHQRMEHVRERLAEVMVNDNAARSLGAAARDYLDRAGQALAARQMSAAESLISTADALTRAVDHIRHFRDPEKVDFPPRDEQARHLERAYFRIRQADYFQAQSKDAHAKPLVRHARQFYQRARQAYDRHDSRGADEYAKVAEEIVKALESLARLATPTPVPPRLK